jgi:DNA-binding NarL/FixJ family response regulator
MTKDIHVLLIEDDPYARDLMSLLLTRDWRTRVVGEVGDRESFQRLFAEEFVPVDVVVLDTEVPRDPGWPSGVIDHLQGQERPPRMLYTGTKVDPDLLRHCLQQPEFGGYVLKNELLYTLAYAIALVDQGGCVVTRGVKQAAYQQRIQLPPNTNEIEGRRSLVGFTPRESEIVRLGILFNLAQRDVADELLISPEWVSEVVSKAYEKLGLRELLSGEVDLDIYFQDTAILSRWEAVLSPDGKRTTSHKTPWMATLAFHLLTIPEVTELIVPG